MRAAKRAPILFALCVLLLTGTALPSSSAGTDSFPPPPLLAGAIRGPSDHDHVRDPLPSHALTELDAQSTTLKAIAIVGDVESHTSTYKSDMDTAVTALQDGGVTVQKFYYGEGSFDWADIVAAAQGAHFLLYMGHGVYWSTQDPIPVGGFYLGPGQFVSPNEIRQDLSGVMAEDNVVILSHVCFSAGDSASDSGPISQEEAARRVAMYADPFVDVGAAAYFANNYSTSAARTVNHVLQGTKMGDTFKEGIAYNPSKLVDLSFDEPGYDLWLNGEPGHWNQGFVGLPNHVFESTSPELGPLPDELIFTYSIPDAQLLPNSYTVKPLNVGNDESLSWNVVVSATWLSASPVVGTTPDEIVFSPTGYATDITATYTGTVTVEVTAPTGTAGSPQQIQVILNVIDTPTYENYLPLVSQSTRP